MQPIPHRTFVLAGGRGLTIGIDLVQHAQPLVFPGYELKYVFSPKMPRDRVIVVVPEQLCMASATCRNTKLRAVIEVTVVL